MRVALTVVATAGGLAAFLPAAAATPPPVSGIAQYVEEVPTSAGGTGANWSNPQRRALPAAVARKLAQQGGADATALREIATSSTYGAPQSYLQSQRDWTRSAAPASSASVEGRGDTLLTLAVALFVLTAGLAFAGVRGTL